MRYLRHVLCILALMWTALINGQPFFFPDTTSYVRAADMAMYLVSGHRISTSWTERYSGDLTPASRIAAPASNQPRRAGNDIAAGQVMSGRSPYIGAALYLSYVTSNFWLFVIGQAALAYWLIRLALRRFGVVGENTISGVVALLAATSSLPYFNSLLLADALASFGILAFLLIATDSGTLRRWERVGLVLVVIMSVISHLTHIVMLMGMVGTLALLQLLRLVPANRRALTIGALCILIGILSTGLTSYVVTRVFHKPPQLVPLMTARFIADGPGASFIRAGCPGKDFAVCSLHVDENSAQAFLWSTNASHTGFLTATPEQRSRMAAEDTAFALATWKAYPLRQTEMIAYNSLAQMLTFDFGGLNTGCWHKAGCWDTLPAPTRDQLRRSLSGQNLWPDRVMTWLLYASVSLSVIVIAVLLPRLWRASAPLARTMACWLLLSFVAMAICDVLGGAISEPQYRYQGRLVWLAILFAAIVAIAHRQSPRTQARTPD